MQSSSSSLSWVVPGAYLVRCGEEVREDLRHAGLMLARRFLVHAVHSDYLLVFNTAILASHCKPEEGTWASRLKAAIKEEESSPVVVVQQQVVVKKPPPPTVKKSRPGRRTRQMLKALITASSETPVVESASSADDESAQTMSVLPAGINLVVAGKDPARSPYLLRPFRVDDKMQSDRANVEPHLTIYYPPCPRPTARRDRGADLRALEQAEKCKTWIKELLKVLQVAGIIGVDDCVVQQAQADLSRLSRPNLISMQCRFKDTVPMEVRNAVHAILRSSLWFKSLLSDKPEVDTPSYLLRCWWREPTGDSG